MNTEELIGLKSKVLSLEKKLTEAKIRRQSLLEEMTTLSTSPDKILKTIQDQRNQIDSLTKTLKAGTDSMEEALDKMLRKIEVTS